MLHHLESGHEIQSSVEHSAGGIGIDLGFYDLDTPIGDIRGEGSQSQLLWLREVVPDPEPAARDLARLRSRNCRVVGTPERIADVLAVWRDAGVNSINVINATTPSSYVEFIDHMLPVLRDRGLAQREYPPGTLRAKLTGSDLLDQRHPAAAYRGAFT